MRVTHPSRLVIRWALGLLLNVNQYYAVADKTATMLLAPSYAQNPLLRKVTVFIIGTKTAIDKNKTLQAAFEQLS